MGSASSGEIEDLYRILSPYTKTSFERFAFMGSALKDIDKFDIRGDVVECGVWSAGNIILSRMLCQQRVCWLYDTFAGMTRPQEIDKKRDGTRAMDRYIAKSGAGWTAVSMSEVRENLAKFGVLNDKYLKFVQGDVEHTLIDKANLPDEIAILRLDTDWYSSTKIELEVLYPRVVPGGFLIVDDYGHWMGAKKAVDDYFGAVPRTPIDYSAIMIRKSC